MKTPWPTQHLVSQERHFKSRQNFSCSSYFCHQMAPQFFLFTAGLSALSISFIWGLTVDVISQALFPLLMFTADVSLQTVSCLVVLPAGSSKSSLKALFRLNFNSPSVFPPRCRDNDLQVYLINIWLIFTTWLMALRALGSHMCSSECVILHFLQ